LLRFDEFARKLPDHFVGWDVFARLLRSPEDSCEPLQITGVDFCYARQ
jgi:hypothetical protein